MTVAEFIESLGLTMETSPATSNPNMEDGKDMDHWICTIHNPKGGEYVTRFSQGKAHRRWKKPRAGYSVGLNQHDRTRLGYKPGARIPYSLLCGPKTLWLEAVLRDDTEPAPPDLASVLDCLASDASGHENARNFADWCADYGYDEDSRKAERIYNACGECAKELRHLLGREHYETLLFKCDRL